MSAPIVGEYKQLYRSCLERTRKETYRDTSYRTEKRSVSERGPQSTTWVSKCRKFKDIGLFTTAWMYYWECMNCGKKTDIGVWDNKGSSYGDGKHL